jgi:hypothetical protein
MKQTSGNMDHAADQPNTEHPSTVQDPFDSQCFQPTEIFRGPDLVPRPPVSNARNSNKANGKGHSKRSDDKGFRVSHVNNERKLKNRTPKKRPKGKARTKRFSSK